MKTKFPLFVGLLVLGACANQPQGFYIANFYPVAPGCDGISNAGSVITGNGYLDVAAGGAQYFTGLRIIGGQNVEQSEIVVGGTVLERANRNTPVLNQMVVNYRLSKRVGGAPKPYLTNFSIPFSDNGEVLGAFQVISPELGLALFDGLNPSPGVAPSSVIEDFVDISVDVEFTGEFTATRTPFTTGVLTLPLRAYRSNPAPCPTGSSGYVKYFDPSAGTPPADGGVPPGAYDACHYVGQSVSQLYAPPPPSLCCAPASPNPQPGC